LGGAWLQGHGLSAGSEAIRGDLGRPSSSVQCWRTEQVLAEEQRDDVVLAPLVDRDARVAALEDRLEGRLVERRRRVEAEAAVERRHHGGDGHVAERQRAAQDLGVLDGEARLLDVDVVDVDVDEREQLLAREDAGDLAPEQPVEQLRDRPRDREAEHDEDPHDRHRARADLQPVARADRLRHDLAEDDDDAGGDQPAHDPARHVGEQDGDHRVHHRVAQQQRAEQQVATLPQRQDALGVLDLARVGRALDEDLQVLLGKRHQAQVEAREQAGQADQYDRKQQHRRLVANRLAVVVGAVACYGFLQRAMRVERERVGGRVHGRLS